MTIAKAAPTEKGIKIELSKYYHYQPVEKVSQPLVDKPQIRGRLATRKERESSQC